MNIRSLVLSLFALLSVVSPIIAQETEHTIGAKVGFASSSFRGADIDDVSRRNLVTAGVFYQLAPGRGIFALQPELLYAPKGGSYENESLNIREDYRLEYLELPVLLKFAIPIDETIYPNIFFGPQVGFRLSETYDVSTTSGSGLTISRNPDTRGVDYGGVFGGGVDFRLDGFWIGLGGRYTLGFNEIQEADQASDIQNGAFSLQLGVGVLLGD